MRQEHIFTLNRLQESDTDVYDGTDHRLTFELKVDDIDDAQSRIKFVCIAPWPWSKRVSPHVRRRGQVNETMCRFLGIYRPWYGNAIVVACLPTGVVIDFARSHIPHIQSMLQR